MCGTHAWAQNLRRPEEGVVPPAAAVTGGCELPNVCSGPTLSILACEPSSLAITHKALRQYHTPDSQQLKKKSHIAQYLLGENYPQLITNAILKTRREQTSRSKLFLCLSPSPELRTIEFGTPNSREWQCFSDLLLLRELVSKLCLSASGVSFKVNVIAS